MIGVHEDEIGSDYYRAVYRRGHVVRKGDMWGVVVHGRPGTKWYPWPTITWWAEDGCWLDPVESKPNNISAPYVHTYEGIPDEVLAKATYYLLIDNDDA